MCAINRKIFYDGNVLFFACLCACDFVLLFRRRKTYRTATKTTRSRWMKMTKNGNNKIKSSVRFSALVIIIFSNILGIHFSRRQTMLYGVLQTFLCVRWSAFTFISWKSLVLTETTPTYFYLILFNRESVVCSCGCWAALMICSFLRFYHNHHQISKPEGKRLALNHQHHHYHRHQQQHRQRHSRQDAGGITGQFIPCSAANIHV